MVHIGNSLPTRFQELFVHKDWIMNIHEILRGRILVLDGAMGTVLQNKELTAEDFGGTDYEGCNEYLNITRPDVVHDIHTAYLDAGADILLTNTFGGTHIVLSEYNLQDQDWRKQKPWYKPSK